MYELSKIPEKLKKSKKLFAYCITMTILLDPPCIFPVEVMSLSKPSLMTRKLRLILAPPYSTSPTTRIASSARAWPTASSSRPGSAAGERHATRGNRNAMESGIK